MQHLLFFLFCSITVSAQLKGRVTSVDNQPIPYVNIYMENSYTGTTSNENGYYELAVPKKGTVKVVFQYLGYKTQIISLETEQLPETLHITLIEETTSLAEVVINSNENPANRIIRAAIENRELQLNKINSYAADFYSKGLIRIKNLPEKFMGQELNVDIGLDSTRSGILYLSETISKIKYQKPDKLSEKITASKVSGDSNGFSFNNASDVDFNFYENTIEINSEIVSPIANYAFNYYRYKLEGVFYDSRGHLINKIKVIPRRKDDRVFTGTIYIVEDQWALYGLELRVNGSQVQIPAANWISIKQNLSYDESEAYWVTRSQVIDFEFGFFGFKGDGSFIANYSNYKLNPAFTKEDFSNEIIAFEGEANKKKSSYWSSLRPVPLTEEELNDYIKKESLQTLKASKTYRDSIDLVDNKFKIRDLISGYSFSKSFDSKSLSVSSPFAGINLNSVQGYNSNLIVNYTKRYDDFKKFISIEGRLNYSFDAPELRGSIGARYRFNSIDYLTVSLNAGIQVQQFNAQKPISNTLNSISTLFFDDNYMKLYENRFIKASYNQELFNGFGIRSTLSYEDRRGLFNISKYSAQNNETSDYTSNNPLAPLNYTTAPFINHTIVKFKINSTIRIKQKYLSYPGRKQNIPSQKYPKLNLSFEKGMAASRSNYNYEHLSANLNQALSLENKGVFKYNVSGGTFFGHTNLAFMDFKHFNGNQTNVSLDQNYLTAFKNLEYYEFSTAQDYLEYHVEHDFNGYILGKIPFINSLNFNLIVGFHGFSTKHQNPYKEISCGIDNIGWGKLRFLRIDYVRSYSSGYLNDGLMFGISL